MLNGGKGQNVDAKIVLAVGLGLGLCWSWVDAVRFGRESALYFFSLSPAPLSWNAIISLGMGFGVLASCIAQGKAERCRPATLPWGTVAAASSACMAIVPLSIDLMLESDSPLVPPIMLFAAGLLSGPLLWSWVSFTLRHLPRSAPSAYVLAISIQMALSLLLSAFAHLPVASRVAAAAAVLLPIASLALLRVGAKAAAREPSDSSEPAAHEDAETPSPAVLFACLAFLGFAFGFASSCGSYLFPAGNHAAAFSFALVGVLGSVVASGRMRNAKNVNSWRLQYLVVPSAMAGVLLLLVPDAAPSLPAFFQYFGQALLMLVIFNLLTEVADRAGRSLWFALGFFWCRAGVGLGLLAGWLIAPLTVLRESSFALICIVLAVAMTYCAFYVFNERQVDTLWGIYRRPARQYRDEKIGDRCSELASQFALTPRELEVAVMLAHDESVRVIAERLVISQTTVKSHVKNIYRKLDVHSRKDFRNLIKKR